MDNQLRFRRRRLNPLETAALPTRVIRPIALLALALELRTAPAIRTALDVRLEVVDRQDVDHPNKIPATITAAMTMARANATAKPLSRFTPPP